MSKFPNSSSGAIGNRVVEKTKIDNTLFFDNLDALGPNWGEAFVETTHCTFSGTPSQKYKILRTYNTPFAAPMLSTVTAGVASIGTDLFLCGNSSIRPSKYNIANDTWTEDGLAYNDYGSLVAAGGFGFDGNAYFYTNNPSMGTSVNSLEIKKYNPVSNTWTNLTALSSNNLATVIYGFMGVANGYAYFMQMIKSNNATYVPAGFPTVYRYQFSSDTWSSAAVAPPLLVDGGFASANAGSYAITPFRANNTVGCKYSSTEFLIHVRGFTNDDNSHWVFTNTEEIYRFDATANTFTFLCRFKGGSKSIFAPNSAASQKNQNTDCRIFYNSGIVYMWYPWLRGLKAYSLAEQKQYFIPIESSAIWSPILCEEGGKVYMFSGYHHTGTGSSFYISNANGIIIDLNGISAFLNKEKTVAVSLRTFD